jgi:hypothetical protein
VQGHISLDRVHVTYPSRSAGVMMVVVVVMVMVMVMAMMVIKVR